MIRHALPDVSDEELYSIMLMRNPAGKNAFEELLEQEQVLDFVEKADREALEKERVSIEKNKIQGQGIHEYFGTSEGEGACQGERKGCCLAHCSQGQGPYQAPARACDPGAGK